MYTYDSKYQKTSAKSNAPKLTPKHEHFKKKHEAKTDGMVETIAPRRGVEVAVAACLHGCRNPSPALHIEGVHNHKATHNASKAGMRGWLQYMCKLMTELGKG